MVNRNAEWTASMTSFVETHITNDNDREELLAFIRSHPCPFQTKQARVRFIYLFMKCYRRLTNDAVAENMLRGAQSCKDFTLNNLPIVSNQDVSNLLSGIRNNMNDRQFRQGLRNWDDFEYVPESSRHVNATAPAVPAREPTTLAATNNCFFWKIVYALLLMSFFAGIFSLYSWVEGMGEEMPQNNLSAQRGESRAEFAVMVNPLSAQKNELAGRKTNMESRICTIRGPVAEAAEMEGSVSRLTEEATLLRSERDEFAALNGHLSAWEEEMGAEKERLKELHELKVMELMEILAERNANLGAARAKIDGLSAKSVASKLVEMERQHLAQRDECEDRMANAQKNIEVLNDRLSAQEEKMENKAERIREQHKSIVDKLVQRVSSLQKSSEEAAALIVEKDADLKAALDMSNRLAEEAAAKFVQLAELQEQVTSPPRLKNMNKSMAVELEGQVFSLQETKIVAARKWRNGAGAELGQDNGTIRVALYGAAVTINSEDLQSDPECPWAVGVPRYASVGAAVRSSPTGVDSGEDVSLQLVSSVPDIQGFIGHYLGDRYLRHGCCCTPVVVEDDGVAMLVTTVIRVDSTLQEDKDEWACLNAPLNQFMVKDARFGHRVRLRPGEKIANTFQLPLPEETARANVAVASLEDVIGAKTNGQPVCNGVGWTLIIILLFYFIVSGIYIEYNTAKHRASKEKLNAQVAKLNAQVAQRNTKVAQLIIRVDQLTERLALQSNMLEDERALAMTASLDCARLQDEINVLRAEKEVLESSLEEAMVAWLEVVV